MRAIARSGEATFAEALLIAITTHAILVWMLGRMPLPTLVPRSEPERRPALIAIDIFEVAQEPEPSPVTPSASGPRLSAVEAASAPAEPVSAPMIAPHRRRSRALQRATVTAPSAAIESTAPGAVTGAAAEAASEETASAGAAEVSEGTSTLEGAGDGDAASSSEGPSSDGTGTGGTTTTAQAEASPVAVDPCGSRWTGVWEGRTHDGASHDGWSEYILTLEQRGEVVMGSMYRRRGVPNDASRCEFTVWHATTQIWGGLEGEELSLRSWPGRPEDYVSECGLSADWFSRNWGEWDWTVRFRLRGTRVDRATGTCSLGRDDNARFGTAAIEFTRTACAPALSTSSGR